MNRNYNCGISFHIFSAAKAKTVCLYLQKRLRTLSESVRSDDITAFFEHANRVMPSLQSLRLHSPIYINYLGKSRVTFIQGKTK